MASTIELLLTESVENLGIVGDVVKVRTGYARNYLLPRDMATKPSQELIDSLKAKRAAAQAEVAAERKHRSETINKLTGYELVIEHACNDAGILYGAVTQQEISAALIKNGFGVRPRDVRLSGAIKRVDTYDIHVKFETELETHIKLSVKPDRVLAKDEKADMDFDMEGNLVEGGGRGGKGRRPRRGEEAPAAPEAAPAAEAPAEKPAAKAAAGEEENKKAARKPREDKKKA